MTPEILSIGSLNMDLVMRAQRMPYPGETLTGKEFHLIPGGKGANQAVACARLGAETAMVGSVGDDAFGRDILRSLEASGVDISRVKTLNGNSTGTAMILVDEHGENRIIVFPGANAHLEAEDIQKLEPVIHAVRAIVMQFEIPMATILQASEIAHRAGVKVVLNAAPAKEMPAALYKNLDVLILNEVEAGFLTGMQVESLESAFSAGDLLISRGVDTVCITLGERGAILISPDGRMYAPAIPVNVVDTTAAGDSFVGGFVASLVHGSGMEIALRVGVCSGCLAVTRLGAQSSIPGKQDVLRVLSQSEVDYFDS